MPSLDKTLQKKKLEEAAASGWGDQNEDEDRWPIIYYDSCSHAKLKGR